MSAMFGCVAAQVLAFEPSDFAERRDAGVHLVQLARDPRRVLARGLALALEEDGDAGIGDAVAQRLVAAHARALRRAPPGAVPRRRCASRYSQITARVVDRLAVVHHQRRAPC